jgi:hypothetical protein
VEYLKNTTPEASNKQYLGVNRTPLAWFYMRIHDKRQTSNMLECGRHKKNQQPDDMQDTYDKHHASITV